MLLFVLTACSRGAATKAKYEEMQSGMSYQECVKLIGREGVFVSGYGSPAVPNVREKVEVKTYSWKNPNGTWITAIFENDKLARKSEGGL